MPFLSESEELHRERLQVERKLNAQGRAFAKWFAPRSHPPIDHFIWRSLDELLPIEPEPAR